MLILASTSDLVKVITGSALNLDVHASWLDFNGTTVTPGTTDTNISTATTTTVVASPASSTQRNVKTLTFHNKDASSSNLITIEHVGGGNTVVLHAVTLPAGYTFSTDGVNWLLLDANGNQVVSSNTPGRLLKVTMLTSGTTFTTGTATNSIRALLQAGGGAGGACPATSGEHGGGGGSGGGAEWYVSVQPNTAYTYAIGAGGTGGAGTGGAGGNTTLTVGGTTCTANGGSGGILGASVTVDALGGAGGTISTNGTLNWAGNAGECSRVGAAAGHGGAGAASDFGGGAAARNTLGAGNSAASLGFGGGGGGGWTNTTTAENGGAGAAGCIVIYEYS